MSKFPKIEYCVFDMDGLLTTRNGSTPKSQILVRYGKELTWDVKSKIMGTTALISAQTVLSSYGLTDQLSIDDYMKELDALKEVRFRQVQPMVGAVELVQHLHKNGIPIAIGTGSGYKAFLTKTSHLPHMFDLFPIDAIVTADSGEIKPGRGKPNPDVFLAAARRLGRDVGTEEEPENEEQRIERSRGLVFEDAVPGAQAGVRAGMSVVWVPDDSLRAVDPEATHGAAVIVDSLHKFRPEDFGLPPLPKA